MITGHSRAIIDTRLPFNHDGSVTGVTTGLRSLDRQLGGLQPSDLMILAGRVGARPRLRPGRTLAASPTDIGGNAARRYAQTQGMGLFDA
jgi:replicative DNA helicase